MASRPPAPGSDHGALSKNEKAKDFTIVVENKGEIQVNPLVLRSRSGLFRDMFNSVRNDFTHRVTDTSGLSLGALNEVFHFMQWGRLSAYFHADPEKLKPEERQARLKYFERA